jgi:hypothetical protein
MRAAAFSRQSTLWLRLTSKTDVVKVVGIVIVLVGHR